MLLGKFQKKEKEKVMERWRGECHLHKRTVGHGDGEMRTGSGRSEDDENQHREMRGLSHPHYSIIRSPSARYHSIGCYTVL